MYTLFSNGKLSCVFKERLLIIVGSLATLSGALTIYSQPMGDLLPWALIAMGSSILAVMVYDRTHSVDTLLAQGAVPDSKRLMALQEKHAEIEEKAKVMLMGRRDRIRHPALRLIIQSLFYDTEKHVKILEAIMHEMEHGGPAPTGEANCQAGHRGPHLDRAADHPRPGGRDRRGRKPRGEDAPVSDPRGGEGPSRDTAEDIRPWQGLPLIIFSLLSRGPDGLEAKYRTSYFQGSA
jgi:hypothetical protein